MTSCAVVTIVHGRREHRTLQHLSLARGSRQPEHYVVVAIDDPEVEPIEVDGLRSQVVHVPRHRLGLPLAAARNRGVAAALASGAEVAVLLDVDCLAGPGLVAGYVDAVDSTPDVVWCGPVTYLPPPPAAGYDLERLPELDDPHPGRPAPTLGRYVRDLPRELFWSLSCGLDRGLWRRLGGFCERYVGYGAEDTDFGTLAAARGVEIAMTGSARAFHQHHPVSDPPVEHLGDIVRNARIYRQRWSEWPMPGWLADFARAGLVEWDPDDDDLTLLDPRRR